MKYREACAQFEQFQTRLREIWDQCYDQAKAEIAGNWQDPDVMRRRSERADKIADARLSGTLIMVHWEDQQN